jgi:hypothetical protein
MVALHPGGRIVAAAAENTVQFWDISTPSDPAGAPGRDLRQDLFPDILAERQPAGR